MIKLVSFFIFVAGFIWTWSLLTTKNTIGIDVHAGIQSKLAILIQDSIKAKRPNSSNFAVQKLYTEKMDDNKIKAYFSYRYSDAIEESEKVDQTISGEAVLTRGLSEDPKTQKWVIQSVKTDASNIAFQEGLVITSDGKSTVNGETSETKSETATPAASEEKKKH
ncbi:MAG: hypothetical protein H7256_02570 [Bdellovibrio sp.]|nr:hypothetical protein [Bdellovibrio sp.]